MHTTTVSKHDVFELWHRRLGHPSSKIVKSILGSCNFVFTKDTLDNVCIACQQGKFHKLPFSKSITEYSFSSELVIFDLWGLTSIQCKNNWYYVSFVDMCSRFNWVYLIQRKSQAIECFMQFQQLVRTQFDKDI